MSTQATSKNGEARTTQPLTFKDATVQALEGAKDVSSAALGGVVHVVADTTSHTLKAAEGVSDDLTSLTRKVWLNAIRGFQDVTAALGTAMLENARGGVKGSALLGDEVGAAAKAAARGVIRGASEIGAEMGLAAKAAALGLIQGSAEVGAEFGQVCKNGALGAIRGSGEVAAELGTTLRHNAVGTIQGGAETALSLEEALKLTALAFLRGVAQVRAEGLRPAEAQVLPAVPAEEAAERPPQAGKVAAKSS